jgi:hypothetical protein
VLSIEPNNRRAQDAIRQLDHLRSLDEKLELARGDLRRGDIFAADRQVKQILELDPNNEGALELQSNVRLVQSRNVIPYPQLRSAGQARHPGVSRRQPEDHLRGAVPGRRSELHFRQRPAPGHESHHLRA